MGGCPGYIFVPKVIVLFFVFRTVWWPLRQSKKRATSGSVSTPANLSKFGACTVARRRFLQYKLRDGNIQIAMEGDCARLTNSRSAFGRHTSLYTVAMISPLPQLFACLIVREMQKLSYRKNGGAAVRFAPLAGRDRI